jgi:ABC-type spermidine/putrescine transport system permease subunit II
VPHLGARALRRPRLHCPVIAARQHGCRPGVTGRPVILEEFGLSSDFASGDHAAHYYRQVLYSTLVAGATGWIAWNNTDYDDLAAQDPYRHHPFEMHFGLTDHRGRPKAALAELARLSQLIDKLPVELTRAPGHAQVRVVVPEHFERALPFSSETDRGDVRRVFSLAVLSTQMFPGILFLLPLYLTYVNVGQAIGISLYGSYLGLIITYLTFALPFAVWMLAGYFSSIPRDIEEAALVDGTSHWGALFRVVLPVSRPGIVAVSVFAFMTAWGEVLFASVLTASATRTLAIGLQEYATQGNTDWNQLMAASVVVSLPVVIGFLALQRHLVRGLTSGSVK